MPTEPVLTMREIADGLGVSIDTVRSWRRRLDPPFPRPVQRSGLYGTAEVVAWCRAHGRSFPPEWSGERQQRRGRGSSA